MKAEQDLQRLWQLDIRVRRKIVGTEEGTGLAVYCPLRGVAIPLGECSVCEHCDGVEFDPTERASFIVCRTASAAARKRPDELGPRAEDRRDSAAGRTPISQVMTSNVVCVRPDLAVEDLAALFLERSLSGAPVINDLGRPIGVVSKTDLIREYYQRPSRLGGNNGASPSAAADDTAPGGGEGGTHPLRMHTATVADIMMPVVMSLPVDASIARAAALMSYEGIHRLPVVSPSGHIVGLLSTLDILRWIAAEEGYSVT